MTQLAFEKLTELIQQNDGLRNALGAAQDRRAAVEALTEATVANRLDVPPGQIEEFLSRVMSGGVPIAQDDLESLAAGGAASTATKQDYSPFRDPYWSELDLPPGTTFGFEGKPDA